MRASRLIAATFLLTVLVDARAMEIEAFEKLREKSPAMAATYLHGVGEGYGWANVVLEHRGDQPLFCTPPRLAVTVENHLRIAMDEVDRLRESKLLVPGHAIEMALRTGLERTFPCEKPVG